MRIISTIALFALWLILSGSYHPVHMALGAITACTVVWLGPKAAPHTRRFGCLSALLYMPWLFMQVLKSGLHVSRLILHPALPIKPELVSYETKLSSDGELVVLGNSITLTPGTITVEIAPRRLIVHAIDTEAKQDLLSGALDAKVGALFSAKGSEK